MADQNSNSDDLLDKNYLEMPFHPYIHKLSERGMKVPLYVLATDELFKLMHNDKTLEQGKNVARLPGIVDKALIMPDGHQGYGFPIGGVAAFDYDFGIISPGGIGFDINCGVALLRTPLKKEDIEEHKKQLAQALFENVPAGLGVKTTKYNKDEFFEILVNGVRIFRDKEDKYIESHGSLSASYEYVSQRAIKRGLVELGTLGSGNHFLEVQYVESSNHILGIDEGQVVVMIHTGSRGYGHQIASDFLRLMEESAKRPFVNRDLIYAEFHSELGQRYFESMKTAANFAWVNRYLIAQKVKQVFSKVFGLTEDDVHYVYDVAHNIAKIETHFTSHGRKKLIVHRKGATRAIPRHNELIEDTPYYSLGQPVLIPGSMGTESYVLIAQKNALNMSFGSAAHGAGRKMSRHKAKNQFNYSELRLNLEKNNILTKSRTKESLLEEAPEAYKDVSQVVKVTHELGIAKIDLRLRPMIVIKG